MLTERNRDAHYNAIRALRGAFCKAYEDNKAKAKKLKGFLLWAEPSGTTKAAVEMEIAKCTANAETAWNLWIHDDNLQRAWDAIAARPWVFRMCDGEEVTTEGYLPNGERTSLDEAEALKMLADYYAAKEQARASA